MVHIEALIKGYATHMSHLFILEVNTMFLLVKWNLNIVQCSSDMSEPKYTRNSRQPNTRIRVCIYAHTHIQYIRVCLISMYELTYCFFFS